MLEFSAKTVLVTGAAGAIGRETALLFARQGARVVAADLSFPAGVESGLTGAGNPEEVRGPEHQGLPRYR
jgi:NAD(P)-dependent dehydrogenase (short-subunit alcohol dehydrogenase family)